ncbi:InlB B-repeat-containing protein [Porcincola intestinalis]|uniref:InlB B-repeat-containing protein n=1 Tax=Porcincola intestinalis TaxID=2606632 RepID=UPI002E276C90
MPAAEDNAAADDVAEPEQTAVEQADEATPAPAVEENNAADDVAEPEQAAAEQADEVAPAPAVEENAADGITKPETQDTADETPDEPEFPEAIDKAPARGGLRGPGDIAIDAVNFPDANFRAFVAQYDLDSDGYLSAAELAAVTTMNCSGKSIASLQGVEFFTALTELSCAGNNLTALDVSQNTALTVLDCSYNNLTTLDVSAVPALKDAVENGSHDTSNSAYDKYKSALGELRVDKTVTLVPAAPLGVAIDAVNFPDDNFRAFVAQYDLDSDGYLSAAELAAVTTMDCSGKSIASLQGVEFFTALTELLCYDNNLTTLDMSQNTALTALDCSYNNLTTLDVSQNTALTELGCGINNLTTLDVSQNSALTALSCSGNNLTTLDVSQNTALTELGCVGNNLTALDMSQNTALTELLCYDNNLTTLDVSQNTALTELSCYGNNLATLDVSAVPALKDAVENGSHYTSNSAYDKYVSALGELRVDKTVTIMTDAAPAPTYYTVSFDANGHGTAPAAQTVEHGKPAAKPADPTESGWTFGGWYKEAACTNAFDFTTPITADITLYAKWTKAGGGEEPPVPITYTVTFDENGHGTAPSAQTVESGKTATKPAGPTATGWKFGGWYQDATCNIAFDFATPITANITLYAKWTKGDDVVPITKYTITYVLNGGTLDGMTGTVTVSVEDGATITLPKPTKSGYTFDYWEGSRYEAGASYKVTGDHTFTARWKSNTTGIGGNDTSPKTGDNSHIGLWIALMAISLIGLGGVTVYGKGRKRRTSR